MTKAANINSVAVVGAGTMGQGIALSSALAGYDVLLFDIALPALQVAEINIKTMLSELIVKGKLQQEESPRAISRIKTTIKIDDLIADLVIEAVVERLDVKQKLFKELEAINKGKAILATNTSSIPVTQIAAGLKDPTKFIGLHFFNPAHIMKLVEVIPGSSTAGELVKVIADFARSLNKFPVTAKDSPGFIVNRVARHYYVEALKLLEENAADVHTIDRLMRSSGFKMGPFELMDLIGVDTNFSVTSSMFESFFYDPKFRPSRIQHQKVMAGHWGRKTGKGFYEYPKK